MKKLIALLIFIMLLVSSVSTAFAAGDKYEGSFGNNGRTLAAALPSSGFSATIDIKTDVDCYSFNVTDRQDVSFSMTSPTGKRYWLGLLKDDGKPAFLTSDAGTGKTCTIKATLNEGKYFIAITPSSGISNNYGAKDYYSVVYSIKPHAPTIYNAKNGGIWRANEVGISNTFYTSSYLSPKEAKALVVDILKEKTYTDDLFKLGRDAGGMWLTRYFIKYCGVAEIPGAEFAFPIYDIIMDYKKDMEKTDLANAYQASKSGGIVIHEMIIVDGGSNTTSTIKTFGPWNNYPNISEQEKWGINIWGDVTLNR